MGLLTNRKLGLFKVESTYNTDSTPVVATDALFVRKLDITPLQVEAVSRELIRPTFGANASIVTATQAALSVELEMAGTPTAGTAFAPLSALMRSCGMAEVAVASTSVTYNPISTGIQSLTSYFNIDGVQHKITGARSSMKASVKQGELPVFMFDLTGNFSQPTAVALGTPTNTQRMPVAVTNGNTTLSLFGVSIFKLVSFEMDVGNEVNTMRYANAPDEVTIVNRKVTGKLVIDSVSPTVRNFFNDATSSTTGAFNLTQGNATGNKVEIAAPKVSVSGVNYGDMNGVATLELDLVFEPNTGNDDFIIKFL